MSTRAEKQGIITWFRRNWAEHPLFSTAFALVVMILFQTLALGFDFPTFGRWLSTWCQNWINILRNNANIGVIALGMTFVIISGGIELAVGSTLVAIGAVVMVAIDTSGKGWFLSWGLTGVPAYFLAIILGLAVGFVLGELTGLLITKGKIPPFIATLGTMKICRSVTQQFMQGYNPVVPKGFLKIASTEIGGQMVMPIIYWLILAWILNLVAKHTAFGRHVYAVGSNERAAKLSGINVQRVKRLVYMLIGVLVAVSSILQVSRIGAMDYANAGSGYEMDAIAAVIVGGTSMSGGRGTIGGTVLGVLIIAVMNNLLNLLGVPPFLREAFKGIIVICAVLLQKKEKN
ncbi:MAG: ABC transporter permease [Sphaerochaeta sp.]|jgi:ribose transport system permease protein|nr:ABC transporter permease [Sphaerochaeta sp.]MCI2045457.1 ABC transporter permease [Sphaerochaeta sp.]MCI2076370.1 ABC transporter permease [Sphaerochaeta sp.]MCI2097330.1 ABC transporter permease [Sphaerochaeta sp.]MCI2104653.1 ABC transporter permease [Sphaerochaeta sp.]